MSSETAKEAVIIVRGTQTSIQSLTEELGNMKKSIVELKQKYVVLNEKNSKNEQYSRKNNLIFTCLKTPTEIQRLH